ncbi:MAG: septum formation family protein [Actinomycetaceae bacterium]|nr:septum formation family protein [Actinomycetaceae bacterium]
MTTRFTHKAITIILAASLALAGCATEASSSSDNERDSSSTSREKDRDSGSDRDKDKDQDKDSSRDKDKDETSQKNQDSSDNKDQDSGADQDNKKENSGGSQQEENRENNKSGNNPDESTENSSKGSNADNGNKAQTQVVENWMDFKVGDCLIVYEGDEYFYKIDCKESHHLEVFYTQSLGTENAPYPSEEKVDQQLTPICQLQFINYVGTSHQTSKYQFEWLYPDEEEWNNGDRTGICLLFTDAEEETTGSAKK